VKLLFVSAKILIRVLLGSVAEGVVRVASVPVLLVCAE